jgi:hypothetical protein
VGCKFCHKLEIGNFLLLIPVSHFRILANMKGRRLWELDIVAGQECGNLAHPLWHQICGLPWGTEPLGDWAILGDLWSPTLMPGSVRIHWKFWACTSCLERKRTGCRSGEIVCAVRSLLCKKCALSPVTYVTQSISPPKSIANSTTISTPGTHPHYFHLCCVYPSSHLTSTASTGNKNSRRSGLW